MNLKPVTGKPFCITCAGCRGRLMAGDTHGTRVYADLDGLPFTDYYCALCAGKRRAGDKILRHNVTERVTF